MQDDPQITVAALIVVAICLVVGIIVFIRLIYLTKESREKRAPRPPQ
jgi:hypothetical protein